MLVIEAALCGYDQLLISRQKVAADQTQSLLVLAGSSVIDRLYYEQWTLPPLRFLYFNVAQSLSVFYGSNPWHYYLTQGYPLLLTTFIPFGLAGLYRSLQSTSSLSHKVLHQLSTTCFLVPTVLSLIAHKEVRFIYPLLPPLNILAASPFTAFFLPTITPSPPTTYATLTPRRLLLVGLAISTLALSLFTTTAHQVAPLSVLTYLRNEYSTHYLSQPPSTSSLQPAPSLMTVGFLMPCHSTPWRSHLVFPGIKAWALGCEPPINLDGEAKANYVDEADRFYADPIAFLQKEMGQPPRQQRRSLFGFGRSQDGLLPGGEMFGAERAGIGEKNGTGDESGVPWDGGSGRKIWTEYIVFFAQLEPTMERVLRGSVYGECWRGWNSWVHDDWRRRGDVVVWCVRGGGEKRRGKDKKERVRTVWW